MDPYTPRRFQAIRLPGNPIIHPGLKGLEGEVGANINGPSLILLPSWIKNPLGRYYLYFAHHQGQYIRLAWADRLEGPWTIHPGGVLHSSQGPGRGHIASPDVHVDNRSRQIRMYFHQPGPPGSPVPDQVSFVATSGDGLNFLPRSQVLGKFYFRVFFYDGWFYAFAKNGNKDGIIYRSRDGLSDFASGPHYLPGVRHTAMWVEGSVLYLLYTLVAEVGVCERIYLSTIDLSVDWMSWHISPPQVLLEPQEEYEGVGQPLVPSAYGPVSGPVRQLRDPAYFQDQTGQYLLYSVAGEQGIAIARLREI